VDETGGRGVVVLDVRLVTKLAKNVLSQDLAELDTHLVVRVDAPDGTLDVNLVLVESNQGTQSGRGKLLEHDAVGGLVALEDLALDESLVLGLLSTELLRDLLLGLAESQSLRLGKEVGEKDLVVLAAGDGVVGLNGGEEVTDG
jgi:hypothetical protein